jgi:polysaccharide export outer membrane protein
MALGQPQPVAPPGAVVSQVAAAVRPDDDGGNAAVVASAWRGVDRVGGPSPAADDFVARTPPLAAAARASIDMPQPAPEHASPTAPPRTDSAVAPVVHVVAHHGLDPGVPGVPKEGEKQSYPLYVIEPPDVLRVIALPAVLQPVPAELPASILVRMDGTISLGVFGTAYVAGLTIDQARAEIARVIKARTGSQESLEKLLLGIQVEVLAFNSKVYYVITDGGGYGEQVYKIAIKGNETVLDAIGEINGLPNVASKKKIWVARVTPEHSHPLLLKVDWRAITMYGSPGTNYQIFPGDRIFVQSDALIQIDSALAKILAPVNRVFGSILLGSQTINSIKTGSVGSSGPR